MSYDYKLAYKFVRLANPTEATILEGEYYPGQVTVLGKEVIAEGEVVRHSKGCRTIKEIISREQTKMKKSEFYAVFNKYSDRVESGVYTINEKSELTYLSILEYLAKIPTEKYKPRKR